MNPMRYFREAAEANAFTRQGKQLPKGRMGMFNDNGEPKIDDMTTQKMNEWDNMSVRDRFNYVNQLGPKLNEPFFPGQDPLRTKRRVTEAFNKATRG